MFRFFDPVTSFAIDCYCKENDSDECYRANEEKAIAVVMRDKRVDRTEAIRLIENSCIDTPVKCDDCEFWCE